MTLSEIAKGCAFKQGPEMGSLGMIAQQKDAEAVLATLSSSVADLLIISTSKCGSTRPQTPTPRLQHQSRMIEIL